MLEERDLGSVYGFQWRHYGAEYENYDTDYTGKGIDQLARVIEKLKTDPTDRRMIVMAWNPLALPKMALPPCHYGFQVTVIDGRLNLLWNQRSVDTMLGLPFNIASYALLTHMIAHVTGYEPGEFVHTFGDVHIYNNHFDQVKEQLTREPRPLPTLKLNPDKKNIDEFTFDDITLEGYDPHPPIKGEITVVGGF